MIEYISSNMTENNEVGTERSNQNQYVDIHCHCLPAVDDGPTTMPDAIALCKALVDDGIGIVIATPHQLGRFNGCNEASQIREKVSAFNEELKNNNIALTVMAGADVRVDERICDLLKTDKLLTLADGGKYILLEFPHQIFIDIEPLIFELSCVGVQVIISHPERHPVLSGQYEILLKWFKYSTALQITASSLLGDFGPAAQESAWKFLSSGLVSFVATDSHDLNNRRPRMRTAFNRISIKLGEAIARKVCIENPLKVLNGQDVEIVSLRERKDVAYERISGN